jgi:hypothetical protein
MSILIRGRRVVTAADDYVADALIEGERIALIGAGSTRSATTGCSRQARLRRRDPRDLADFARVGRYVTTIDAYERP